MKLILLAIELFFCALDQMFDKRPRPAGPELGCDDQGAWDDGTDPGEPWPVFISPARQIAELDYASLENAASGGLGPVDHRLLGRRGDGTAILERR